MQPFDYMRPTTLSETLAVLDDRGVNAHLLAGGTDLVVALRNGSVRPELIVDIKGVEELGGGIRDGGGSVTIAATTTMAQLERDARIRAMFPALVEAAVTVGSIQIRNRATLAGNVCHASPAADTAPALLVYGAVVNVLSVRGSRQVDLRDFFVAPGQAALTKGELVRSIELPAGEERPGATYSRITRRRGVDLATVSVCCLVGASGRTRFAFGAVGPRPFRVDDESGVLADPDASDASKDAVLHNLIAHASPISDVRGSRDYRAAMLLVLCRRTLRESIARLRAA